MTLNAIIENIQCLKIVGETSLDITGVSIDSRQVKPGSVFIAMRGTQVDGHKFIPMAVEKGAVAVICEEIPQNTEHSNVTYIQVSSCETAVGPVATAFYGFP